MARRYRPVTLAAVLFTAMLAMTPGTRPRLDVWASPPQATAQPAETATATPIVATPTLTATALTTATVTATATAIMSATVTPTATVILTETATPTDTATMTPTQTATPTPSPTVTPLAPTGTPSPTPVISFPLALLTSLPRPALLATPTAVPRPRQSGQRRRTHRSHGERHGNKRGRGAHAVALDQVRLWARPPTVDIHGMVIVGVLANVGGAHLLIVTRYGVGQGQAAHGVAPRHGPALIRLRVPIVFHCVRRVVARVYVTVVSKGRALTRATTFTVRCAARATRRDRSRRHSAHTAQR